MHQRRPDSTRDACVGQVSGEPVGERRRPRHAPIRTDGRRPSLDPAGWPCGVVAVAHKTRWTGPVTPAPALHAQVVPPPPRPASAQVRAVRTVRLSAAAQPAIEPVAIRAETPEGGMCPAVWQALAATAAARLAIDRLDAGVCARAHAPLSAEAHQG